MEENNKINVSRRGFLKTAALTGAVLAIPAGLGKVFASGQKQTAAMRPGLQDTGYWVREMRLSKCRLLASV